MVCLSIDHDFDQGRLSTGLQHCAFIYDALCEHVATPRETRFHDTLEFVTVVAM